MKIKLILLLLLISGSTFGKGIDDDIAIGKRLSRVGNAIEFAKAQIRENFPNKFARIGEYVPVIQGANFMTILCFQKNTEIPVIRYTITEVDSTFEATMVDTMYLAASETELIILKVLYTAKEITSYNNNEFFQFDAAYEYRYIPVYMNNAFEVYIMPYSKNPENIVMGGDYLIRFDKKLRLLMREVVHNEIYILPKNTTDTTEHIHLRRKKKLVPSVFCILQQHKYEVNWKTHAVIIRKKVYLIDVATLRVKKVKLKDFRAKA